MNEWKNTTKKASLFLLRFKNTVARTFVRFPSNDDKQQSSDILQLYGDVKILTLS